MKFKIRLDTVNNAALFVAKCSEYKCDIDYSYDRYVIDAKSLMGVLSTGLEHTCMVEIHTDDAKLADRFRKSVAMWIVGEDI